MVLGMGTIQLNWVINFWKAGRRVTQGYGTYFGAKSVFQKLVLLHG